MFQPPFCPYRRCSQHLAPSPRFCVRHGTYHPRCRPHPVQRYRCRGCRRTFSRQTFRMDYRDHRPHLNPVVFQSVASGIGIRQTARNVGLSLRCCELKLRKVGRHLRRLNLNLRGRLPFGASFHFDELESYEGGRNTRPVTIPVLIESESRFVVWAESAPIRPRGRMTAKRREQVARAEKRYGPRRDLSTRAVARTLERGVDLAADLPVVSLFTDEKVTYPGLAERAFGKGRVAHHRTNSKLARGTWNPLFRINHEEAVMRDIVGRLRRDSWLVSKKRRYLDILLHVHIAYRNLIRKKRNQDRESPAEMLGFAPRRLTEREVLSWRQEFGRRSVHPLSRRGRSVATYVEAARLAA